MRKLAALALVAAGLSLAFWGLQREDAKTVPVTTIALEAVQPATADPVIISTGVPRSNLSHAVAPTPSDLSDAPSRQAIYDAEANPGDFVTPPNVSVGH